MKKNYFVLLLLCALGLNAQTTVNYPQRVANYGATFTDGGGNFDSGTDEFGMWANYDAKQSVAWRNFTEDATTTGTTSTMQVGDSFTTTVSATQASYGVIGIALLSSPTATTSWADRINNYAVQVNLNGNIGNNDPWEVVSTGGTINASSIGGSTTYADFKFKFTLNTATTMTVSINDGAEDFIVTLNNTNITGYSIYIADDWNGAANANTFWKPSTEYTYVTTLGTETYDYVINDFKVFPNPAQTVFSVSEDVTKLTILDISGKQIKTFTGDFTKGQTFNIENISKGLYLVQMENILGATSTTKLIKL